MYESDNYCSASEDDSTGRPDESRGSINYNDSMIESGDELEDDENADDEQPEEQQDQTGSDAEGDDDQSTSSTKLAPRRSRRVQKPALNYEDYAKPDEGVEEDHLQEESENDNCTQSE